jgi:hypothetical protein
MLTPVDGEIRILVGDGTNLMPLCVDICRDGTITNGACCIKDNILFLKHVLEVNQHLSILRLPQRK